MDLDDELRQLLASVRLDVPVRPDAEHLVVAGARRLRRRRIVAAMTSGVAAVVAVVIASVVLAGGRSDVMPPATTSPAPSSGVLVLGPTGLGELRLGQTMEQARATGLLGNQTGSGLACLAYDVVVDGTVEGWVSVSSDTHIVQSITIFRGVRTPEGIGAGSTLDQAKAQYPDLVVEDLPAVYYPAHASVPGNANAKYRLNSPDKVTITQFALEAADQTCGPY